MLRLLSNARHVLLPTVRAGTPYGHVEHFKTCKPGELEAELQRHIKSLKAVAEALK